MTAPTTTAAAQEYLVQVDMALADLPAEERSELLEDLALHLGELEDEGDDRSLSSRLGPPADYAAELRAAAGLPPREDAAAAPSRLELLKAASGRIHQSPLTRKGLEVLDQLRPAWWLARGWLVVELPRLRRGDGTQDFPVPSYAHSRVLGLLLVLLAVAVSVAIGRRRLPRPAVVIVVLVNLAIVYAALVVLASAPYRLTVYTASPAQAPDVFAASPLVTSYGPVTNVFPYAADGTPLDGVLLYDQDGRPLHVGTQQWWADNCLRLRALPQAKDGGKVEFSYPQAYVLDPSGRTVDGSPGATQCAATLPRPKVPLPVFPAPAHPAAKAQAKAKP